MIIFVSVDIISEESLPINRLLDMLKELITQSDTSELLACLFKLIEVKRGPIFLQQLWQKSGLALTDLLDSSRVSSFVKDNVSKQRNMHSSTYINNMYTLFLAP